MKTGFQSSRSWTGIILYTAAIGAAAFYLGRNSVSSAEPKPASAAIARSVIPQANAQAARQAPPAPTGRVDDAETDEIMRGAKPGTPNAVLRSKLWDALYEPDEFTRMGRFQSLLTLMRPEDAKVIEQVFYDADKEGRSYYKEFSAFWARWGKIDGLAAMTQLQADHHLRHIQSLFVDVGKGWARSNPEEALKWLAEHKDDANKWAEINEGVWRGSIEKDPAAAADALVKNSPPPEAAHRLGTLAWMVINTRGLDAGQEWLTQQTKRTDIDAGLLQTAVRSVAEASTRAGPKALAEFIESRPDSAELRQQVQGLVSNWVGANTMQKLDFIAALPEDYYDEAAINKALSVFEREPDALGVWLKGHPSARFYDDAALRYITSLRESDPAAAKAWADTIKDPVKRTQALNPSTSAPPESPSP